MTIASTATPVSSVTARTGGRHGFRTTVRGRFQLASTARMGHVRQNRPRAGLDVLTRTEIGELSAEELEDYTKTRMVWNANLLTWPLEVNPGYRESCRPQVGQERLTDDNDVRRAK